MARRDGTRNRGGAMTDDRELDMTGAPGDIAYEEQKRVAHDGNFAERRALAERDDVRPEILYYLASDPDTEVRRRIALNDAAPRQADVLLAKDENEQVRADVAGKVARASEEGMADDKSAVYRATMDALETLARDQIVRVRQILSETLKDNPAAPASVVETLARDSEIAVAGPVLEHSPVLTDDVLIDVLKSDPVQGALSAIARRVALGEEVSESIVDTGNTEAIAELLGNDSAQIREETLDRIVDDAAANPSWHAPLVHRPRLHAGAARRVAKIVAAPLLADLKQRGDIDAETLSAIEQALAENLDADADGAAEPEDAQVIQPSKPLSVGRDGVVAKRAVHMFEAGDLNEAEIVESLNNGDQEFALYGLALLADLPIEVVARSISLQNAKAIVSICWKANLSMRLAARLQMHLAGIPPSSVLRATASDGFPLDPDEMRWQLEFVAGMSMAG